MTQETVRDIKTIEKDLIDSEITKLLRVVGALNTKAALLEYISSLKTRLGNIK